MTKSAPAKAFCSDTAYPMAKLRGQSVAQEPLGQSDRRHMDTPTTLVRTSQDSEEVNLQALSFARVHVTTLTA